MYADDLQIYHSRSRNLLSECIREVNSDLRKIFEGSRANLMRLNSAKSIVLPIYRGHLLVTTSSHMYIRQRTLVLLLTMIQIQIIYFQYKLFII
jgi:hypothetical protein